MRNNRITRATAATLLGLGAALAPVGVAFAAPAPAAPAPAAPAPAAPAPAAPALPGPATAPFANTLDSRLTVKNDTGATMTVWMGAGSASEVPTQVTRVEPGQTTSMQGFSYLPGGKDVVATIDYTWSPVGSSDRVTVDAKNPTFGWPSLHVQGYDRDGLAAGETVTRTTGAHTLELHRNTDLPDAKDMWVTVKS
ncbi:MAG: hypothetical protein ACH36H_03305 [Candidatus Nanopelagicales bacterium]